MSGVEDIRKVIPMDEIKAESNKTLSEKELKSKLESYKGRIPSIILKDLYETLKGKNITNEQFEKIIQSIEKKLKSRVELDRIYEKLNKLEKMLESVSIPTSELNFSSSDNQSNERESEESPEKIQKVEKYVDKYKYEVKRDEKAYLREIPRDVKSMMFLLKWIEHIIEKVGYNGLEDVLDYYVDIGWISEDVMFEMMKFSKGIKLYHENSDWRPIGFMSVQDHLMSLLYIEALKSGRMNKDILHEVERQISRIRKGVCEIDGL